MSAENVDLIKGIYSAFAGGDVAGVLGRLSPDIIWNEAENFPYADGNPYIGPDAVASGVFARCVGEWDGFALSVEEVLDAGSTVVVLGRYHGVFKSTGRRQHTQFVHVWRLEQGRAVRFQQFADTLQVARVTGTR